MVPDLVDISARSGSFLDCPLIVAYYTTSTMNTLSANTMLRQVHRMYDDAILY